MKRLFLLPLLLCVVHAASSQDDPSVVVSDFSIYFGGSTGSSEGLSEADILKLAPNAADLLLQENYDNSDGFPDQSDSYSFRALLGLKFGQKGTGAMRDNPTLRIGISYQNSTALENYSNSSESFRIDTLVSSQTGATYYVDSTSTKNLSSRYASERLMIDASVVFRTTQAKKLTLYAGAGFSAGISFNNRTEISAYQSSFINDQGTRYDFDGSSVQSVTNNNEGGYAMSAYIPLGLEFRLSKAHPLWSQIHLSYEMRPSISIFDIPELKTFTSSQFQASFGIRFETGQLF
jgi:hypothetical protein